MITICLRKSAYFVFQEIRSPSAFVSLSASVYRYMYLIQGHGHRKSGIGRGRGGEVGNVVAFLMY